MEEKIYRVVKKFGDRIGLDLPYFVKNGFWVMFRQGVSVVSGLFLTITFARLATQEIFGQYQLILSILAIVSIFSIPGLNTSIIRSSTRGYDGDYKIAVKTSFFWSFLGIPSLLGVGGYYYFSGNHPFGLALMISSVFFPFLYAPNTWDSFLQGKGRFDIAAKYSSIQSIVNAVSVLLILFLYRENLVAIISWYLFSYTFFNCYYYWKSLCFIENHKTDEGTLRYGLFLTKINVLGLIADNIDKLLIGVMLSPSALAAYYIVSVIPLKIKDALKPFFGMLYPKLSKIDGGLWNELKTRKKTALILFVVLVFFVGVYAIYIASLNQILFGEAYGEYYQYSKYYAILLFVLAPILTVIKYSQVKKYDGVIAFSDSGYAIFKIMLSAILIYYFGLIGAIISYNLAVFIWLLLYLVAIKKREEAQGYHRSQAY